jgi:hypothetical protein
MGGFSSENGEQLKKIAVYPGLFPDMFPGIDLTVNSGPY